MIYICKSVCSESEDENMPVEGLVTLTEAAKMFDQPRWKIEQWVKAGKLGVKGYREYDNVQLISPEDVRRVIESMNKVVPSDKGD